MTTAFDGALVRATRDKIEKELERVAEIILEGKISTWEDYKRLTGERRALKFSLEAIEKSEQELLNPQRDSRREMSA